MTFINHAQTAQIIKLLCKSKHIAISKLLEDCQIRKSFIYDLEKRNSSPSIEVLDQIATYFDVSVDYLLGRTNDPTPSGRNVFPPKHAADRMVYEILKESGLLGSDGLLSEKSAAVVSRFLKQNSSILKELLEK